MIPWKWRLLSTKCWEEKHSHTFLNFLFISLLSSIVCFIHFLYHFYFLFLILCAMHKTTYPLRFLVFFFFLRTFFLLWLLEYVMVVWNFYSLFSCICWQKIKATWKVWYHRDYVNCFNWVSSRYHIFEVCRIKNRLKNLVLILFELIKH